MGSPRNAVLAGSAAPENGDVLTAGTVQDVWDQGIVNGSNSPGGLDVSQGGILGKRAATAKARAALVGATLTESLTDAGQPEWILSRWAYTRAFHDLDEVERTLDRMGGPKA